MAIQVYEPRRADLRVERVGIVLLPPGGSTLQQDGGRDAQILAETIRLQVIGLDRPGTGIGKPNRELADRLATPRGYVYEMATLGEQVNKLTNDLRLERVIIAGRSAGALGALALARTRTIRKLEYVFAAEPVACQNMPVAQGKKDFTKYNARQKELQNDQSRDFVRPEQSVLPWLEAQIRKASLGPNFIYDKFHNEKLWATNAALVFAGDIAEYQKGVDTTLEFAERSLVLTPEIFRKIAEITQLRGRHDAPFEVLRSRNTTHASYDKRSYFTGRLWSVVERALASSN